MANQSIEAVQTGAKNTLEYRVFFKDATGKTVSPFHQIPAYVDKAAGIVNMVVEVPRHTNAKLEISKSDAGNPIKQDTKKGVLRYVRNVFPYHGYLWNYGAVPQTWECPTELDGRTQMKGDNDPIDILDIGSERAAFVGEIRQVKVLGALAMIDEGETDWKVLAVDVRDPLASLVNDVEDLEKHCPLLLESTRRWFELYKVPDGKPRNVFAFDGKALSRKDALEIIEETHHSWQKLIANADVASANDISIEDAMDLSTSFAAVVADEPERADVGVVFYPEAML